MRARKPTVATLVSTLLVCLAMVAGVTVAEARAHGRQEAYAPLSNSDLDSLVAPIALYPDALVAQILGAATYPDQVAEADTFLKANYNLKGQALINAVEAKPWDPSVQALTQFPSVLDKLSKNIEWTSALGDAAANQQGDVMAAIQRMRAKAYAAGNLKSGDQIKVVKESPDIIVIQPANPQVIFVPTYNPTVVYGAPVTVPGYSTGDVVAASMISFGAGIALGAALSGPSCGWSYSSWGMNWSSRVVYCGGGAYYGNPYWWGGYYPGYYPGYRPPYYPPPRPPGYRPPPPGWRPPPTYPPHRPPTVRPPIARPPGPPPRPTPLPQPGPGRPGRPSIQPVPEGPSIQPVPGRPTPQPGRPGGPSIQPVQPGGPTIQPVPNPGTPRPGPGTPTTRPAPGLPSPQPNARETRGYPTGNTKPAPPPNAFSGTVGGRPASARGNRSLNAPAAKPSGTPAARPSGGGGTRR